MLKEYESYQGTALRSLIATSSEPLTIGVDDIHGRVNGYVINRSVAVYIKHSSKRLTPWRFGFSSDHLDELKYLNQKYRALFVILVCGIDGVACLTYTDLLEIASDTPNDALSIGVARSRNQMYQVGGAKRTLDRKLPIGVRAVLEELKVPPRTDTEAEELSGADNES